MSGHARTFPMVPSRWHWDKTKDLMHLYVMIGAIPIAITIFLTNIFIGEAQLTPIPEGYRPKHWEYHRVTKKKKKIIYLIALSLIIV